jgi:hypothetical protein
MTSKRFRAGKRAREINAVLNRGPRHRGRGDGGHIPENLLEPLPVNGFTRDRLSREAAELLAQLRKMETYDERRADLESQIFWLRQRMEGQCS